MRQSIYPWKRFWVPRGSAVTINADGFLDDPESPFTSTTNLPARPLSALFSVRCLILLGEAGSGKSTELETYYPLLPSADEHGGYLHFNLRGYGTDLYLVQEIFQHPQFLAWKHDSSTLDLVLDGFDEGLVLLPHLADILRDQLAKVDRQRLRLRIVSRTALWSSDLEDTLRTLWSPNEVQVHELMRLRRRDVTTAAEHEGLDATTFFRSIQQASVTVLASSPATLALLIGKYRDHGDVPANQVDLYRAGCLRLCREAPNRRHGHHGDGLSPEQRLIVAARIAAYMIFGQRAAIWLGDPDRAPLGDIPLQDLSGGVEVAQTNPFKITETRIHEVLGTGLFVSYGRDRLVWAHHTYAEFLAALYITTAKLRVAQVQGLLEHPTAQAWKITPQLRQVAAWLACLNPEISHHIAKADPDVLLESTTLDIPEVDRSTVVQGLLARVEAERIPDLQHRFYHYGRKLNHPHLTTQVRPYLMDSERPVEVQTAVLDLIETCRLQNLQDDLAAVVLDVQRDLSVRIRAVQALARVGDLAPKAQLKPLALAADSDEPAHHLKGACLSVVWPHHLTLDELLNTLSRRRFRPFGPYEHFLTYQFAPNLAPTDVPGALRWLLDQQEQQEEQGTEKPIACLDIIEQELMFKAWQCVDVPGVLPVFTDVALRRITQRQAIDVGV